MDPQAPGPAEINCGNCENYRRRHADDAAHARAEAVGHAVSPGLCALNPQLMAKRPDECCSQHSELVRNRMRYQAQLIGNAVAKATGSFTTEGGETKPFVPFPEVE